MASKEHKIVRRAEAMSRLDFLSKLLAEQFNLEPVSIDVTNRDPELAEIQRIERVNELLTSLTQAAETKESDPVKKSTKKHGANK